MGKYDAWDQYFKELGGVEAEVSFAELERLLGWSLPPSAHKYPAWWANTRDYAVWTRYGWSASPDLKGRKVRLIKAGGQARSANVGRIVSEPRPRTPRGAKVAEGRVDALINEFPGYLAVFERKPPFAKAGQLEHHVETIRLRRQLGSVAAAIESPQYCLSLGSTLRAWGIGVRGSNFVDVEGLSSELSRWRQSLVALDGRRLKDAGIWEHDRVWELIEGVEVTTNKARLVALSKTLHHLLPDLVPPIDRAYTGTFLGLDSLSFQNRQAKVFDTAWAAFTRVARECEPEQYVGKGWHTSATKVIDAAIVGFCIAERLDTGTKAGL